MSSMSQSDEAEHEHVKSEDDGHDINEELIKISAKPATKRRTKTGCLTCRRRRIKCDETKPFCRNCIKSKRECLGYVQPLVYKQQQSFADHGTGQELPPTDFQSQLQGQFNSYPHSVHMRPDPYQAYDHYGQPINVGPAFQYPDPSDLNRHDPTAFDPTDARRSSFHSHRMPSFDNSTDISSGSVNYGPPQPMYSQQVMFDSYHGPRTELAMPSVTGNTYMSSPSLYSPEQYDQPPFSQNVQSIIPQRRPRIPRLVTPSAEGSMSGHGFSEDPFDVDAEDEDEDEGEYCHDYVPVRKQQLDSRGAHRSGMLRPMKPTVPASPLFDERNEKVFRHFVEVLGLCMSSFERLPADPLASPRQHLWSYTIASAAFTNPALAHAILAVSGLHISKIQQTSESTALKHFTYAARRVGKLLNVPGKRHEATTLATVLLLGYYEILNADHSRWNLHLAGATRLVSEHDLTKMARRVKAARKRALQISMNNSASYPLALDDSFHQGIAPSLFDEAEWDVDENLIQHFTGSASTRHDQPESPVLDTPGSHSITEADISNYRTKLDLWWWFCKQDLFQSMVSGDRLLMPYEHNISCPPRGQINVVDRPHATFDHLVLILSRLSDFGGKDRHRKQRAVLAAGGVWVPPPWLQFSANLPGHAPSTSHGSAPERGQQPDMDQLPHGTIATAQEPYSGPTSRMPSANEGRPRLSKGADAVPPAGGNLGFGMMPPPAHPPKMHSAFHSMDRSINEGFTNETDDKANESFDHGSLEEETNSAHAEHKRIAAAFDLFHRSLGSDFHPLPNGPEHLSSPFGPPLRYRSPEIACMWAHYYVGRALLQRLHPDMPPAAMVAAGITAGLTRGYTQMVGQICAGLFASLPPTTVGKPLLPRFAAAFMEISFSLLFCGVQYIDAGQRGWTVAKLHNIAQMTGWQTSAAVAAACEIAWEKLAQAGRGPPYTRAVDISNTDVRLRSNLAPLMPQYVSSESRAENDHESLFVSHDKKLISKHGPSRVHWAMGLLSVEEDVRQMNIGIE